MVKDFATCIFPILIGCSGVMPDTNTMIPHLVTHQDCDKEQLHTQEIYNKRIDISCQTSDYIEAKIIASNLTSDWKSLCENKNINTFITQYDFNCFFEARTIDEIYLCEMTTDWGQKKIVAGHQFDMKLYQVFGCMTPAAPAKLSTSKTTTKKSERTTKDS
jgi:hypothetical protein